MKEMNNQGFSLIELSVVLAIVGLIIISITGGAHLMQAAKLNKVISEMKGYNEAVENFRLKYHAWPGDMVNAEDYWGTYADPANIEGTVNGNGDEKLGAGGGAGDLLLEPLRAWQQLALADMITGHYTGVDAGATDYVADTNVPASVIKGNYYFMISYDGIYAFNIYNTDGNILHVGRYLSASNPYNGTMTPADAYSIDKKIDDGIAYLGNIYAVVGGSYTAGTDCVSAAYNSPPSNYILTDTDESCRVMLWLSKD